MSNSETGPIIGKEKAEEINKSLQEMIDPRLFFFCNYTPTPFTPGPGNDEAQILVAVQDLYKFAFDSTFVFKKFIIKEASPEAKTALDFIETLRSVIDHNQSEFNGFTEKNYLKKYNNIFSKNNFASLYESLKEAADTLIDAADDFIKTKSKCENKEEFVESWIEETIKWYSQTVKSSIFWGVLIDKLGYCDDSTFLNYFIASEYLKTVIKIGDEEDSLASVLEKIKKYPYLLDRLENKLNAHFKANKAKIIGEVQKTKKSMDPKNTLTFSKCFYENLWKESVKKTINSLQGTETLLPQSLFNKYIDEEFYPENHLMDWIVNQEWTDL